MQSTDSLFVHPGLKVRPCEWGYGVFTDAFIPAGSLIEECHYLKVPFRPECTGTQLDDYVFNIEWAEEEEARPGQWLAVVMGFGMIYNHSSHNNATYFRGGKRDLFTFYATRNIYPGEQVCISYGEDWWGLREQEMP